MFLLIVIILTGDGAVVWSEWKRNLYMTNISYKLQISSMVSDPAAQKTIYIRKV